MSFRDEVIKELDQLRLDFLRDEFEKPPAGFPSWYDYRLYKQAYYPNEHIPAWRPPSVLPGVADAQVG